MTLDLAAIRARWEAFDEVCARLLASACKRHMPYVGCPLTCEDVEDKIGDEFRATRADVPALVAEVERLRGELRDARRAGAFFRSCAAGGESIETAEAYEMLDLLVRKETP